MARHFLLLHKANSASQVGFAIGILCLCALTLFMWRRRWRKLRACYGYGKDDPVIELNRESIYEYNFGDSDPSTYSGGDVSLCKKNILMGGKCQLPDFSGVIIYDSAGNLAAPSKTPRALTWKW